MNNSDMPIVPIANLSRTETDGITYLYVKSEGLTKLEHFAGVAMQGLLAGGEWTGYENCAIDSVNLAHALLKALETSHE